MFHLKPETMKPETPSTPYTLVMGLGRFGGGVGVTRYLCERLGKAVLVTDREPAEKLRESVAKLDDLIRVGQVALRLGEHREEDFRTAEQVVVNPAVDPRGNPYLQAAIAAGVPLTSEIRLLIQALPNRRRVIGITGSAGKSTTTAMIGHILRSRATAEPPDEHGWRPQVYVGGNLGGTLLDQVHRIGSDEWVVLELSSFMLEGMREDGWSPHIAVVTNLAPNHLDRHGTFEEYVAAKQVILDHQTMEDFCILGGNSPELMRPMCPQVFLDDRELTIPLKLPGSHNLSNAKLAVAAAAACRLPGLTPQILANELRDFAGLPHRLQLVAEHAGVRYFNDSKSTTPEAATLAVDAFPSGKVHLILGGYDKGSDLTALARHAAQRCKAVYTIGKTGDAIADAASGTAASAAVETIESVHGPGLNIQSCGGADWSRDPHAEVVRCGTLDAALAAIVQRLAPGDAVVLSPGCASWDQFENYEQRGAAFVSAVLRYTGER